MKIVDYETLNRMPSGTIFAPCTPCILEEELSIKKEKAKFEVYDGDSNDYLDCEMFLIFDEEDIDSMIKVLKWAKNGCKEKMNEVFQTI